MSDDRTTPSINDLVLTQQRLVEGLQKVAIKWLDKPPVGGQNLARDYTQAAAVATDKLATLSALDGR